MRGEGPAVLEAGRGRRFNFLLVFATHGRREHCVWKVAILLRSTSKYYFVQVTHLCRSLYPTGSPNIRDESSTQQFAGDLERFKDPTFPLVALHLDITTATLYCAGADLC